MPANALSQEMQGNMSEVDGKADPMLDESILSIAVDLAMIKRSGYSGPVRIDFDHGRPHLPCHPRKS